MEDFHKIGKLSLLLSMPMDDLIISKIEEVILSQIDDHIDFIIRSIKEKLRDLIDLNEISDKLNTIWFQFKSQTSLFHTLIQFYLDKSAFVEVIYYYYYYFKKKRFEGMRNINTPSKKIVQNYFCARAIDQRILPRNFKFMHL